MTRSEFTGQFDRLCKGFKHEPTGEQAEAWFRRIGHLSLSVWAESVTTLLCGKFYPKLEEALTIAEREAESQRKTAVAADKPKAYVLHKKIEKGEDTALSKPLFNSIKAFSGREYCRGRIAWVTANESLDPLDKEQQLKDWNEKERVCNADLAKWLPQLTNDETTAFLFRYGKEAVAS